MRPEFRQRFAQLSWKLIEWKLAYYRPELLKPDSLEKLTIPDDTYDAAELEYLELCDILGNPNTLVHKEYPAFRHIKGTPMMEVDLTRYSVQLVLAKHGSKNWDQIAGIKKYSSHG